MARKTKLTEESTLLPELPPTIEQSQVDEFFDGIEPNVAYLEIFRMRDDGRRPQCGRVTLDLLRDDCHGYLRTKFGSGRYLLMGKDSKRTYLGSRVIEVEAAEPTPVAAPNGIAGNGSNSFEREMLLAMIAAQKPIDLGSMFQGMAAMQPKFDVTGILTAMVAVFTALKPPESAKDDWLQKSRELIGLAKDLSPNPTEENLYTVAKDVGTKLIEAIKPRPAVLDAGGGNPVEIQRADRAPAQIPQQVAVMGMSEENLQKWIETQLAFLKEKARRNKDPEFFVDYILDNDEEPGCNAVLIAMERGVTFEMLLSFDSEIQSNSQLAEWFRKLYDGLHVALFSVDTSGQAGDAGNPEANAAAGAATDRKSQPPGARTAKPRKTQ